MSEFGDNIRKIRGHRTPSCTGAYSVQDIYWKLKTQKLIGDTDLKTFRKIVRTMGKNIAQLVMDGYVVSLPVQMGSIMISERKRKTKFVNGQVFTDQRIDWNKTVKLWEDDEEARKDKIVVRYTEDKKYTFVHNIGDAKFKNKYFFRLRFNTQMMRKTYGYAKQNNVKYHTKQ